MVATFSAPFLPVEAIVPALRERGHAVLAPDGVAALCGIEIAMLDALAPSWDALPPDNYLLDGGNYRRRRHSCFVVDGAVGDHAVGDHAVGDLAAHDRAAVAEAPRRAHWQSRDYNALHGGMRRWFEPIAPVVLAHPAWARVLHALGDVFAQCRQARPWFVEAHQFRIDTSDGIGRPTPEGAHRDGVDFVAVFLVGRHGITGGETRVFDADGPEGQRFTLSEPWSLLLLDDARVIHESTPILPIDGRGHRDTLVLTYRAGGFQGDEEA